MKTVLSVILMLVMLFPLRAQKDVTQFLGFPVDGSEKEMIRNLKSKGFTPIPEYDNIVVGDFNGMKVRIIVATNNNKVCRIMLNDVGTMNEVDIRIKFNRLLDQFNHNKRYLTLDGRESIPVGEDIDYEMSINKKRYQAVFLQLPENVDTASIKKEMINHIIEKFTPEQLSDTSNVNIPNLVEEALSVIRDKYINKKVWFMISTFKNEYYITMFYDNEYNRAQGEDL